MMIKLTNNERNKVLCLLYNKPKYSVEVHCNESPFPFDTFEVESYEDSSECSCPDGNSWAGYSFDDLRAARRFVEYVSTFNPALFSCRIFGLKDVNVDFDWVTII